MEKTFSELDTIQVQINREISRYQKAIRDNKKFSDVKLIYLKIKNLQQTADELLERTRQLYKSENPSGGVPGHQMLWEKIT